MTFVQEYDLKFQPATIVRGQGLCKLATKALDLENQCQEGWKNELSLYTHEVLYVPMLDDSWYNDLKQYLQHGTAPNHLKSKQKRALRLKSAHYQLIIGILFRRNYDNVLEFLEKQDTDRVLSELYDGPTRGHFAGETIAHKILREGYYQPTVFKYAHAYARSCKQHKYILTSTDYFMQQNKAVPLTKVNEEVAINFLEQHLITRFGFPTTFVVDNATYFSSLKLIEFTLDKGIILIYAANYYPQGNGVAKSTNKNLICILKRIVVDQQRNWHNYLPNALQIDRVTPKASIGIPFIYMFTGKKPSFPQIFSCLTFNCLKNREVRIAQLFKGEL